MITKAYPAIGLLQVPTSVDWIGFDHYFIKKPSTDNAYLQELNKLLSKSSTEEQQLVVIMDSHYIKAGHRDFAKIEIAEMEDVADSYFELAKSQPKTIAILGYFWPSGFDSPDAIGARNMPENVVENYRSIGRDITKK